MEILQDIWLNEIDMLENSVHIMLKFCGGEKENIKV